MAVIKRGMFKNIFGKNNQVQKVTTQLEQLNSFTPTFYKVDIKNNDVVNACIDCIARHMSKLEIQHKQYKSNDDVNRINGDIAFLLGHQPNKYMNTNQFIYRVVSNLEYYNNSFVFIAKDETGMIKGYYPINAQSYELLQDDSDTVYIQFNFANGKQYQLPYEEVIHIKKFFNDSEFFGSNNKNLNYAVTSNNTALQGIDNAIKSTASLRGMIKYVNGMLKPEDMKKLKDDFVRDYLNLENESGIAVLDSKAEFTPVDIKPMTLDKEQLEYLDNRILKYFGLNESILSSKYTADEWNAFFESVIEPIAIQMEQEFTNKTFGTNAIKNGHRIVFSVDRIRYLSTANKISLIKEVGVLGALTIDEVRKIIDMATIGGEEGAKRLQTLNVVNSNIADDYQMKNESEEQ